jgi:hypothetical protein
MSTTQLKGSVTLASDTGATTTIGNTGSNIVINATNIQKNIKTQEGTIIEDIIGDSDQSLSFSRNYNYKFIGTNATTNLFYIQNQSGQNYISTYGELVVSGGNGGLGAFTGKFSFIIQQADGVSQITLSSLTTDKSYNGGGTVTAVAGTTIKQMYIAFQSPAGSANQNYCATLTVYPTQSYDSSNSDFSITAV